MKILVTGANGFVGSHLCARLVKDGHKVFALVRTPEKFDIIKDEKLILIKGDLDSESLSWVNTLPDDLDTCIHTAGMVHSYLQNEFYKVNVGGTENLVNSLKVKFKSLHFILISSLAASGPSVGKGKRCEMDMDFPVSVYGRSKKKSEEVLSALAPKEWILSVIRPPMVIGPRDSAVLDIFKMVQGGLIILPGRNSRKKLYSFVCVYDLVETISRINNYKIPGIYFSSNPQTITFEELIKEIKKQIKKKWMIYIPLPLFIVKLITILLSYKYKIKPHQLRLTPDKYYELAALNWTCDGSKSERELTQVYKYNLERTITVTLMDYKTRNWL